MSGRPGRSMRMRYVGGDQEERVEEEDSEEYDDIDIPRDQRSLEAGEQEEDSEEYDDIDNPRDQGSLEAPGEQGVQRAIIIERGIFRAAAVCLTALCVLAVVRTTDKVMDCNSAITELQTTYDNLILERDQWKTSYDNMILERDQWKTSYDNMILERDQWKTSYDNMILERDQWKTSYDNMILDRDQWKTSYDNMTLERDQLQSEVNQAGDFPVRLVSGPHSCSGRVEIYHGGSWGTVCSDRWGQSDAQVVCRQVGCGRALAAPGSAHFGQGSGSIWLDEVSCSGSETSLSQCRHLGLGIHNCGHREDAGVVCEGKI